MKAKKHTTIQRIKILEAMTAKIYLNQKEILKYLATKDKEEEE